MFDSIGGVEFIALHGTLDPPGITVENITRPGVDGVAFRQMGSRSEITQLHGVVDVTSFSAANTLAVNCKSLQGTNTTIVKNSLTYDNMFVVKCLPGNPIAVGSAIGGTTGGNIRMEVDFQVVFGATE